CTGVYVITQEDIDNGFKFNTATATGEDPGGNPVDDADDHTEPIPQEPAINLVKDGALDDGGDGFGDVGDLINYTFVVTNTGTVTLTNVSVTDPLVSPISCPQTTLAPGASMTCTGSYAVTQADVDAGVRDNLATATGDDPKGVPVTDGDDHSEPLPAAPGIEIVKEGVLGADVPLPLQGGGSPMPGDEVHYTFVVTNIGNVTLTNVTVTDPLVSPIFCTSGNPIPSLAPGESDFCAGSYTLTQADIDLGQRVNVATATGDPPTGPPVEDDDDHTVPLDQLPAMELLKDGSLDDGGDGATPGDLINYTFVVANTGTVTLTNVSVTDPIVSPIGCPSGNPIPSLAPGESETCTGSYAITQDDIDAGVRDNTATATGQDPNGDPVSDDDDHSEPIPQDSVCLPTVDFDTNGGGASLPAGTIVDNEYVALGMHVSTDDPLEHPAMTFDTANPTGGDDDLGTPNADFGGPGLGSGGGLGEVGANAVPLGNVLIISEDGISGDPNDYDGGGTLIFEFDFPVFIDAVGILDIDGGTIEAFDAGGSPVGSAPIADLGDNSTQAVFLGAADVERLEVTFARGGAVSEILFCADPSTIDLVKDGELDLGANGTSDVGDLIAYTFTVTNTGDLPLSNVSVTDPLVPSITCPSGAPGTPDVIPTLAAGASETCTGSYAITQADLDAGVRANTATASGTDPLGLPVTDDDDHSEPIPAACVPEPEDCEDGEDNDCDGLPDGEDPDCSEIVPGDFCTFTQGGWGNTCQRANPCSGGNPGCFRDCNFDSLTNSEFGLLAGDMVIGGFDEFGIIDGDACYSILLTSAMAVEDYLPASGGGGNSPLDDDHLNPTTTASTNLGTQVVAATLNVLADAQGLRFDGDSGTYPPGTLGTLVFGDCVAEPLQGLSVNEVLDLAHGVLSSCDPSNESLIGPLKSAFGSFNECFVECDGACSCLSLP
ncbi:MAG: hypothetical protein V3T72_16635, partial [Thermoanaerobaculia bacterium]